MSESILAILAGGILHSSLLLLCVLVLRLILGRHIPPRWWVFVWWLVALRLLLPFDLPSRFSLWNCLPPEPALQSSLGDLRSRTGSSGENYSSVHEFGRAGRADAKAIRPGDFTSTVATLWFSGSLILGVSIAAGFLSFHLHARRRPLLADARLLAVVGECKRILNLRVPVLLVASPRVACPLVYGLFRPRIVLPESALAEMTETQLRHIILHELIHVKRGDILLNWILALSKTLFWFNPLVWLACRRAKADVELACDEKAVLVLKEGAAYGETLLMLAGPAGAGAMPAGAFSVVSAAGILGISESCSRLKERIHRIATLGGKRSLAWSIALSVVVGGTLFLVGATAADPEQKSTSPETGSSTGIEEGAPAGWWTGRDDEYAYGVDHGMAREGKPSAFIRAKVPSPKQFTAMNQSFQAKAFLGKRVRLSGYLKTAGVSKWAGFWLRVDDKNGKIVAFDNMQRRGVSGDTDWKEGEIVLDVPDSGSHIYMGLILDGGGQVWMNNVRFEVVDQSVPVTSPGAVENVLPEAPSNLDFTKSR